MNRTYLKRNCALASGSDKSTNNDECDAGDASRVQIVMEKPFADYQREGIAQTDYWVGGAQLKLRKNAEPHQRRDAKEHQAAQDVWLRQNREPRVVHGHGLAAYSSASD